MFRYKIYGLNIKSEIKFEELIVNSDEMEFDAIICYGVIDTEIKERLKSGFNIRTNKDSIWMDINGVAVFQVCNGNKIIVEPYENAELEHIKTFIIGSCMGFLLFQKNIIAIHGGAVEVNGKAIVIVGESGSGKSTLTTALRLKGHSFITDDISTINNSKFPAINPGYPGQRLCEDAMDRFCYDKCKYKKIEIANKLKYVVSVNEGFTLQPIELNALVEVKIGDVEEVTMEKIVGNEKLQLLLRNIYAFRWASRMGVSSYYLKQYVELAKKIPMYKITRPKQGYTVGEQIEVIEKHLNEMMVNDGKVI